MDGNNVFVDLKPVQKLSISYVLVVLSTNVIEFNKKNVY